MTKSEKVDFCIETLEKLSVERGKEGPKNFIRDIIDNSTEDTVDITVKINPISIKKWHNKFGKDGVPELENRLKLTSSISTSNIIAFTSIFEIGVSKRIPAIH